MNGMNGMRMVVVDRELKGVVCRFLVDLRKMLMLVDDCVWV